MSRRERDKSPFRIAGPVDSERKAGVDLAWIVVVGVALSVVAVASSVPDGLLDRIRETGAFDENGVLALMVLIPLGATLFAFRRYRDAATAHRELAFLSLHDPLTGLPDRRHLREVLPEAFRHAWRNNTRAGVFCIDLDGFRLINDTYGHEVGDRLMVGVADRLRRTAGEERFVARYAGDEFVLVDAAPHTAEHCARLARELVALIEAPFELGEDRIAIAASIGVAFGDVASEPDEVLRDAETAMYDAKELEESTAVFSDAMRARLTPATAERRLEQALAEGEFRLFYQPIVALRTTRVVGAEALLRWDDPERGIVPPRDFLAALEETGLIVPVGRWVFEEACRQAARWAALVPEGEDPVRVTCNVSPRQLGQSDFIDDLRQALDNAGVDPRLIYLELTESALIADPRAAWTAMTAVRSLGVGLALDDFGTGYSSLSHLRNFDLELLKLDGSYLAGLDGESNDDAIVRHVVSLARALGIPTLAEGITEESQIERLLEVGCKLGQGYYFSEPQPATIIDSLLRRQYAPPQAASGSSTTVGTAEATEPAVVNPRLRQASATS